MRLTFYRQEVRDLLAAWLALGVAFTLFMEQGVRTALSGQPTDLTVGALAGTFFASLVTVGIGFLLHELAHKVVAVYYGQVAAFKADYSWLFLAIMGGLIGFLFAAPGAVYHRGAVSERQRGHISVAGPITNLLLAAVFLGFIVTMNTVGVGGALVGVAFLGIQINLLLAGFNMLPIGPLDGRKVLAWSKPVFVLVAVPCIGLAVLALYPVGF